MIDTSLYAILRLEPRDSARYDTTYIHRDDFRAAAKDFLDIPDLSDEDYEDRYRESKTMDQTLNRILLSYEPVNPKEEIIQSQQVLIEPGDGKVTNIIINMVQNSKDSLVTKRMMWTPDRSFQVTTLKQLPGQPETTHTYKVSWNEHEYE